MMMKAMLLKVLEGEYKCFFKLHKPITFQVGNYDDDYDVNDDECYRDGDGDDDYHDNEGDEVTSGSSNSKFSHF